MTDTPNFQGFVCPLPLRDYPQIVLGHGSGGRLSADLIRHLFVPLFDNPALSQLNDQAVLEINGAPLAFTTDSFVVHPLFFPGGDIGSLAVHGTINDLAMSGAQPLFLSAGFILEEGLLMDDLGRITTSMANACKAANVQLVTGDTKVVNQGHGDGVYINTAGIGLVPENRGVEGLVLGLPVQENIALASLERHSTLGWMRRPRMAETAADFVRRLTIRTPHLRQKAMFLSGGNQQKVVVAKWLALRPRVLILDEPTRGIDVGAKAEVHALMSRLAAAGIGILMISSELPEIMGMSDRIAVMHEGRLAAILDRAEATQERIMAFASGQTPEGANR